MSLPHSPRKPLVSVVVPAYNGSPDILRQLAALHTQTFPASYEVLVADNGSTDDTLARANAFASSHPNFRVIDASTRQGNAPARNIGAKEAKGEFILFTDQDDIVQPGWLAMHLETLRTCDVVVGSIQFIEDSRERAPVSSTSPTIAPFRFLPYGLCTNLGTRMSVFEQLAGFDELFPAACDVDYCWRAQLAGYKFGFAADAVVLKTRKESLGQVFQQHRAFGQDDRRLYRKFRRAGMPCPIEISAREVAWIALHLGEIAGHPGGRRVFVKKAGALVGRVVGGPC